MAKQTSGGKRQPAYNTRSQATPQTPPTRKPRQPKLPTALQLADLAQVAPPSGENMSRTITITAQRDDLEDFLKDAAQQLAAWDVIGEIHLDDALVMADRLHKAVAFLTHGSRPLVDLYEAAYSAAETQYQQEEHLHGPGE